MIIFEFHFFSEKNLEFHVEIRKWLKLDNGIFSGGDRSESLTTGHKGKLFRAITTGEDTIFEYAPFQNSNFGGGSQTGLITRD